MLKKEDFLAFRRQNQLGALFILVANFRRVLNALFPFIIVMFLGGSGTMKKLFGGLGFSIIIVFILLSNVLKYLNFKFKLAEGKFILKKGILVKETVELPFDRIQSVEINQNFLHRAFQLAALKINTAGSAGSEITIHALTLEEAQSLKHWLKEDSQSVEGITETENLEEYTPPPAEKGKVLLQLSIGQLLVVGLTENHIKNGLAIAGLVLGYFYQFKDIVDPEYIDQLESYGSSWLKYSLFMSSIASIAFILLSIASSVIISFIKFFKMRVTLFNDHITVEAGLLKRFEHYIPLNKIQFLEWSSNILRKWAGFESVGVYQANPGQQQKKQLVVIPSCKSPQTTALEKALFPEYQEANLEQIAQPASYYIVYKAIWRTLAIILVCSLLFASNYPWFGLSVFILAEAAMIALVIVNNARIKLSITENEIQYKRGYLFPKRLLMQMHKIQNISVKQSIFQRKRGLSSVTLYTAAGKRTIPFIPMDIALKLREYLLYRVSSQDEPWM